MDKKSFLDLLERYRNGDVNDDEKRLLLNYFESFQAQGFDDWPSELGDSLLLKEKMRERLVKSMAVEKPKDVPVKRFFASTFLKYAASVAIILGSVYLYMYVVMDDNPEVTDQKISESHTIEAITLKLDDGIVNTITENDSKTIIDSKGNVVGMQTGNEIKYEQKTTVPKELVYNELTVPYGKKFDLVLSDGTQIKLNAGSTIRYPIQFMEGKNREVQVWGEAYFDVAKDKNHPFMVNANNIQIKVLGTKFNVSSYEEDEHINTVLVEGSVQLFEKNELVEEPMMLKPSHKAAWNKDKGEMTIAKVDTDIYTSWTNGRLVFKKIPFKIIRRKLERHYNITIINNNTSLDEKFYNASFDIETIEQVMQAFKENYAIDYSIANNIVTIN